MFQAHAELFAILPRCIRLCAPAHPTLPAPEPVCPRPAPLPLVPSRCCCCAIFRCALLVCSRRRSRAVAHTHSWLFVWKETSTDGVTTYNSSLVGRSNRRFARLVVSRPGAGRARASPQCRAVRVVVASGGPGACEMVEFFTHTLRVTRWLCAISILAHIFFISLRNANPFLGDPDPWTRLPAKASDVCRLLSPITMSPAGSPDTTSRPSHCDFFRASADVVLHVAPMLTVRSPSTRVQAMTCVHGTRQVVPYHQYAHMTQDQVHCVMMIVHCG